MKKIVYFLLFVSAVFSACKSEPQKTKSTERVDIVKLQNDIINMRLGSYIKTPEYVQGKLNLTFIKDYEEFKQTFPASMTTEEMYKKNFSKKFEIEKVMAEIPAKIMKEYKSIQSVQITLPYNGKTYTIDISKSELEKYAQKSMEEIDSDWNKNYAEKNVFDEAGRKAFCDKFVKIQ